MCTPSAIKCKLRPDCGSDARSNLTPRLLVIGLAHRPLEPCERADARELTHVPIEAQLLAGCRLERDLKLEVDAVARKLAGRLQVALVE